MHLRAVLVSDSTMDPRIALVEDYIEARHEGVTWHITLNNHASTRPKIYGGPIVKSVAAGGLAVHLGYAEQLRRGR